MVHENEWKWTRPSAKDAAWKRKTSMKRRESWFESPVKLKVKVFAATFKLILINKIKKNKQSCETRIEIGILAWTLWTVASPTGPWAVRLQVCTFCNPEAEWNNALVVNSVSLVTTSRRARQSLNPILGTTWNNLKGKQLEMARGDAVSPRIPGTCRSLWPHFKPGLHRSWIAGGGTANKQIDHPRQSVGTNCSQGKQLTCGSRIKRRPRALNGVQPDWTGGQNGVLERKRATN